MAPMKMRFVVLRCSWAEPEARPTCHAEAGKALIMAKAFLRRARRSSPIFREWGPTDRQKEGTTQAQTGQRRQETEYRTQYTRYRRQDP